MRRLWRNRLSCICVVFLVFWIHGAACGQVVIRSASDIPDDIKTLINQARHQKVIQVRGVKQLSDRVTKTDLLVFEPGGVLELTDVTDESVILIAKEVHMQDGSVYSTIRSPLELKGPDGETGGAGNPGRPTFDPGDNAGQGRQGGQGGNGGNGFPGQVMRVPDVYLIFGSLADINPHPSPVLRVSLTFDGATGGNGGRGGHGGDGGNGEKGFHASCSGGIIVFCDSGPGSGGNGGDGGFGGQGGPTAHGGDGSNLFICGPPEVLQQAQQFSVSNKGKQAGQPGQGGNGGSGGQGGQKGRTCGTCNDRDDGKTGRAGRTLGDGPFTNQKGLDGLLTYVTLDVSRFFPGP